MTRIPMVDPKEATGQTKETLDGIKEQVGRVPNIVRVMANSPVALQMYVEITQAVEQGSLSKQLREQIALTVSQANGCNYCLAAHTAMGKMLGLSPEAAMHARHAQASAPRDTAALQFAIAVRDKQGWVTDEDLEAVRAAGWSDAEIMEITANVIRNIFNNYFNHIAGTEVDFPAAPALT